MDPIRIWRRKSGGNIGNCLKATFVSGSKILVGAHLDT